MCELEHLQVGVSLESLAGAMSQLARIGQELMRPEQVLYCTELCVYYCASLFRSETLCGGRCRARKRFSSRKESRTARPGR